MEDIHLMELHTLIVINSQGHTESFTSCRSLATSPTDNYRMAASIYISYWVHFSYCLPSSSSIERVILLPPGAKEADSPGCVEAYSIMVSVPSTRRSSRMVTETFTISPFLVPAGKI